MVTGVVGEARIAVGKAISKEALRRDGIPWAEGSQVAADRPMGCRIRI